MSHPLRAFRKKEGISQERLAELLGVSRATVIRWESGKASPRPADLPAISEKTGIPARELRPDLAEMLERA
jgi:transcriptional regulator with XRE-family HTH domain